VAVESLILFADGLSIYYLVPLPLCPSGDLRFVDIRRLSIRRRGFLPTVLRWF